jgi:hypothetical protein
MLRNHLDVNAAIGEARRVQDLAFIIHVHNVTAVRNVTAERCSQLFD